jgi:acetoin utilization deacetylase AcuC-like enzyme
MLEKTIQINKNLLPIITKRKLEKSIQMRIMSRVKEMKDELAMIESGGDGGEDDEG